MTFQQWYDTHLFVRRFPVPGELRKLKGLWHVLNVSDSYVHGLAAEARDSEHTLYHHWHPLNECVGEMGLNSLYAALYILHMAERQEAKVLLHCHAGVNRSPMVAHAYYFLRTGQHWQDPFEPSDKAREINVWAGLPADMRRSNLLLRNIEEGLLPPREKTEAFLLELNQRLDSSEQWDRGGLLTELKINHSLT